MAKLKQIASFSVDHDLITEGIYISRIDGDITTYDMRTRVPNSGVYMDNLTMHSFEHLFATMVRQSQMGERVIYFGPMGCQTGFYLLVRDADNDEVLRVVKAVLADIACYTGDMPGGTRRECGNYQTLAIEPARALAAEYLAALDSRVVDFKYREK